MDQIVKYLKKHPEKAFIIDGIGALFSAFMLGFVLVRYQALFRIPLRVLYLLAFFSMLFAAYDFACVLFVNRSHVRYLKILSLINVAYCILSLSLALFHLDDITTFGWVYFIIETLIVLLIARVEWLTSIGEI